jgi:uncharacterized protein (DUF58 family)
MYTLPLYRTLKGHVEKWVFQQRGPESGVVTLVQRRVFIIPARSGLMFAFVLVLMLLGSINYNLSLGFVLTFLLGAMGINTMLHTFRNIAGLRVAPGRVAPVFAGDDARFMLSLTNVASHDRYNVNLTWRKRSAVSINIPAGQSVSARVAVPAEKRGLLRPGRFTVYTEFPLGIYYAWSYVNLDMRCVVYPKPAPPGIPLPRASVSGNRGSEQGRGDDDFAGLRQYQPGDSPRHIAWKVAARGQGLLTKQFSGQAQSELWLSWELLPATMGVEEKLSRLARWVIDAESEGLSYGLRLPGHSIPMGSGEGQRDRCLEALAMHEVNPHAG